MPDGWSSALALLPCEMRSSALEKSREEPLAEELRLRRGRPPTLLSQGREKVFSPLSVTEAQLTEVLANASRYSLHAHSAELRQGYLCAAGGVRVGVCGTVTGEGEARTLRDFSSVCIRIPRQIPEAGREVMTALEGKSVLVLSPPGGGKTTFLRELVRHVSDAGCRVGLADARGELAAVWEGLPQFDVGCCTDVLSGGDKAEAAMLLLRTMNPQVVALDEISDPADTEAALRLNGCGVRVFATGHAAGLEQLRQRPAYRPLLENSVFQTAVIISRSARGQRQYRAEPL